MDDAMFYLSNPWGLVFNEKYSNIQHQIFHGAVYWLDYIEQKLR